MPEEIGCAAIYQTHVTSNMTHRPHLDEQYRNNPNHNNHNHIHNNNNNHFSPFSKHTITTPTSPVKLITYSHQTSLTNGTHCGPGISVTSANGDLGDSTKSKKSKGKPLSIPESPTIVKHATTTTVTTTDLHPSRVGKYTIIRTLGRGNFAQVKLAIHVTTGREVAIKMIDKTTLNENCRIKLAREVRVLKTLTHPNIVRLYEVIETTRHVYLVMEYAKNGEVFEHLLKAGRMAETKVRSIFRQLISAVEYCHQKNIVHRDLKAENLLLDENHNLKLADFGFANTFDTGNTLNTFCGSPPYAAPELLCGQKYHGPEVDVWALGVILYMLVCGQLPFEAFTLKELHARVLSGKYRIPFYMSGACEGMLKKMLVLNPTKRATLKELMNEEWINVGYEDEPLLPFVESKQNYSDPIRRAIMNELGFDSGDLKDAFENHRFNNITATYLLLEDTETRHRLTRMLQNEYESPSAVSPLNTSTDQEVDSSDESSRCDNDRRQLSHSAITSNTKVSRAAGSWRTGSLRDDDPQKKSNFCLKPSKQLCRPSLNLPGLIATSEQTNGSSFPRFSVNMELTGKEACPTRSKSRTDEVTTKPDQSDVEMDSVAPPTPNGLRRFRTPSLERARPERKSQPNESVTTVVTVKKSQETENSDRMKTDPITRRDFMQLVPTIQSHSTVIVSDSRHNDNNDQQNKAHKTLDPLRKLPRVISPADSISSTTRNEPVDLLNPSERSKYLYSPDCSTTRPFTQKIQLRRYATYTEGDAERSECGTLRDKAKPALSRWVHIVSPDHRNPDRLEKVTPKNNNQASVIIVSNNNRPDVSTTTRILTPEVKPSSNARRPVSRHHSDLSSTNYTLSSHNGVTDEQQTPHGRMDRMPRWRRHSPELRKSHDKPPTSPHATTYSSRGMPNNHVQPVDDSEKEDSSVFATVVRPVRGTGPKSKFNTIVVLSNGRRTPTVNSTQHSPIMNMNLYRKPSNGTPTDYREHMDRQMVQKSNTSPKIHTGEPVLVFSAPRSQLNSPDHVADRNGPVTNGAPILSQPSKIQSTGNTSFVLNGTPASNISSATPTPVERSTPTPTQSNGSPSHYRGWWHWKNGVTSDGLHRSECHRDTPQLIKPIPKATPDFPHAANGYELPNSDCRCRSDYQQQHQQRSKTEGPFCWQSPLNLTNPSVKNRQSTGTTIVPRKQNWAYGIAIRGRNAQVLMLSTLRILEDNQIDYVYLNPYRLMCTYPNTESRGSHTADEAAQSDKVTWEIEVVHLSQIETYGVRFKYLSGPTEQYRTLEKAVINEFPQTTE